MQTGMEWSETAAGGGSGATATRAANAKRTHIVTSISGHVDEDEIIQILDGSTVVGESKIDVSAEGFSFNFSGLTVVCSLGAAAKGYLSDSNADCQVNISGYSI